MNFKVEVPGFGMEFKSSNLTDIFKSITDAVGNALSDDAVKNILNQVT